MIISEERLQQLISETIGDIIANKLGGFREGQPQSIKDVILGNGWKLGRVQTPNANTKIVQVFSNYNPMGNNLSVEELIEDLNIYFQDNRKNMTASIAQGSGNGEFIQIVKGGQSLKEYRVKKEPVEPVENWAVDTPMDNKSIFNEIRPKIEQFLKYNDIKIVGYGVKNFNGNRVFSIAIYSESPVTEEMAKYIEHECGEPIILKPYKDNMWLLAFRNRVA